LGFEKLQVAGGFKFEEWYENTAIQVFTSILKVEEWTTHSWNKDHFEAPIGNEEVARRVCVVRGSSETIIQAVNWYSLPHRMQFLTLGIWEQRMICLISIETAEVFELVIDRFAFRAKDRLFIGLNMEIL
jgi:hypothetical protein